MADSSLTPHQPFIPALAAKARADAALSPAVRTRLASYARNTQRALRADWRIWHAWCVDGSRHLDGEPRQAHPITPEVIIEFIHAHSPGVVLSADGTLGVDERETHRHVKSAKTLSRYLSSLRVLHRLAGFQDDPTANVDVETARRIVMRGRTRPKPKKPFRLAQVETTLASPAPTLIDKRDRAMLAVAYSGMLRRAELVALRVDDITFDPDGSGTVEVRFSKTDQTGAGQSRYLAGFAVEALTAWLTAAVIRDGPLFRGVVGNVKITDKALTDREVARAFKRLAKQLSVDGMESAGIAGHSTRIGAAHDLVEAGFDVAAIAQAGGWASLEMPNYYTRELRAKQSAMAQLTRKRASTE